MNVIPGNKRAVKMIVNFHCYSYSSEFMAPMNMKIKMTDCSKPPRCAGERK